MFELNIRKEISMRYGQIITSKVETEVESLIFGDKVKIPKGNKIIVGFDKMGHHIHSGMIQPFSEELLKELDGKVDAKGLAEYLAIVLWSRFSIEELAEEYEFTKEDFQEEIENALEEIGAIQE